MTTPDTMWSTRNVMVASAWIDANSAPATQPDQQAQRAAPTGVPIPARS